MIHPYLGREPQKCELCGAVADTRPYGPNKEEVCFECGMKDEPAAKKHFFEQLDNGTIVMPDPNISIEFVPFPKQ